MSTWSSRTALRAAVAICVALTGCGWLARMNTVKMNAWTNPAYPGAPTLPTQIGPLLDCSSRRPVVAADTTRTWLAEQFFPAVWQKVGADSAPAPAVPHEGAGLCEHLYDDWYDGTNYAKEDGGPKLAGIAQTLLDGRSDANVFVVVFARRAYCRAETREIRDATGNPAGSITTGREICEENGQIDLAGYLLSPDGHLLYMASGRIEHHAWFEAKDVTRAVDAFVGKYPRGTAVAASATARSSR